MSVVEEKLYSQPQYRNKFILFFILQVYCKKKLYISLVVKK